MKLDWDDLDQVVSAGALVGDILGHLEEAQSGLRRLEVEYDVRCQNLDELVLLVKNTRKFRVELVARGRILLHRQDSRGAKSAPQG